MFISIAYYTGSNWVKIIKKIVVFYYLSNINNYKTYLKIQVNDYSFPISIALVSKRYRVTTTIIIKDLNRK